MHAKCNCPVTSVYTDAYIYMYLRVKVQNNVGGQTNKFSHQVHANHITYTK